MWILTDIINGVRSSELYRRTMELVPPTVKPAIRRIAYEVTNLLQYGQRDMFLSVAIETTSVCNRRCSFCPNHSDELRGRRPQKEMDEGIYRKIIDDLKLMHFTGTVSLQHYGEPLLDSHLEERIRYAHSKLPEAHIMFKSNGDYLTPERFQSLVASGVDEIFVTNYAGKRKESAAITALKKYLVSHPEMERYITIRNGISTLSNRGGLVEVDDAHKRIVQGCIQESYSLNIDVDGNAVMCSNDYLGQHQFGNVKRRSISSIWNSLQFREVRERHKSGVFQEEMCQRCTLVRHINFVLNRKN